MWFMWILSKNYDNKNVLRENTLIIYYKKLLIFLSVFFLSKYFSVLKLPFSELTFKPNFTPNPTSIITEGLGLIGSFKNRKDYWPKKNRKTFDQKKKNRKDQPKEPIMVLQNWIWQFKNSTRTQSTFRERER